MSKKKKIKEPEKKKGMKKGLKVLLVVLAAVASLCLFVIVMNAISRADVERYIDEFYVASYEDQLVPSVDERGNYYFTTDREFKVMQLTDIHLGGGFMFWDGDKKAIHAVAEMINTEMPDLVIVTGDISFAVPWSGTLDNSVAHGYVCRLMEKLGVYWTVTLGNHDSEKYNFYDRAAVANMYADESLEHCLFSRGPLDVFGEGNHLITVRNSKGLITSSYVMLDSNAYTDKDPFGIGWDYDNVHADQIEWYQSEIDYYTVANNELYNSLDEEDRPTDHSYAAITSYMYMHIPPTEMLDAYNEAANGDISNENIYGIVGESGRVVCSSEYPDELFETVVELGSTKAIFFGHDHLNSLRLNYRGVLLAYGYSIDYSAYAGSTGYQRGCTILTALPDGGYDLRYSNYYSGAYDYLPDGTDTSLPEAYR